MAEAVARKIADTDALAYTKRLTRCQRFASVVGALAIIIGGLVLLGWLFDIEVLKRVLPGAVTMKVNTACGFVLSGSVLYLLAAASPAALTPRVVLARIGAVLITTLGAATLAEYLFNIDSGIDTLLSAQVDSRMAPATALGFTLFGIALLLRDAQWRAALVPVDVFSVTVPTIGLLALLGYAYGVEALYRVFGFSSMAVHTALLFVLLGLGLVSARPERGLAAIVVTDHGG